MAILTSTQLSELRGSLAGKYDVVTWTKPQVNAAFQAIENAYEAVDFKVFVDGAGPFRFSAQQVSDMAAVYSKQKGIRGGA